MSQATNTPYDADTFSPLNKLVNNFACVKNVCNHCEAKICTLKVSNRYTFASSGRIHNARRQSAIHPFHS